MLVIINDVLDYSKIEAEKLVLHEDPFDLERIIHELIMLLQANARDKGIELLVDYDLFLPTRFVGDPGRIRQVMTNLLGNAVKFTESGHVLVRVVGVVSDASDTCRLHVTIEDTGIGIPEDKVGHIFGEFNQVDDARNRKFEGTGLGLAISEKLIHLMNGEIWVESREGTGSTFGFSLSLPLAEETGEELRVPEGLSNVLIVESHEVTRMVLERQFSLLGAQTLTCRNGTDALSRMTPDVDLVVTDHVMPEMDGIELAEALRAKGHCAPVILLSSNPGSAEQDPGKRHLHAVLQKPVARRELFVALNDLGPLPAASDQGGASVEGSSEAEPQSRAMRVLAAEDNKTNRLVFSKMVKDLDIELQFAENGAEAVAQFQSFAPDIVFMDISMPEMDGKEATGRIRGIEAKTGRHVPIVAMTAHAMGGDEEGILAAGLDHYLTKPLGKEALIERIILARPPAARDPLPAQSAA